jgi:hypothetical protein
MSYLADDVTAETLPQEVIDPLLEDRLKEINSLDPFKLYPQCLSIVKEMLYRLSRSKVFNRLDSILNGFFFSITTYPLISRHGTLAAAVRIADPTSNAVPCPKPPAQEVLHSVNPLSMNIAFTLYSEYAFLMR